MIISMTWNTKMNFDWWVSGGGGEGGETGTKDTESGLSVDVKWLGLSARDQSWNPAKEEKFVRPFITEWFPDLMPHLSSSYIVWYLKIFSGNLSLSKKHCFCWCLKEVCQGLRSLLHVLRGHIYNEGNHAAGLRERYGRSDPRDGVRASQEHLCKLEEFPEVENPSE